MQRLNLLSIVENNTFKNIIIFIILLNSIILGIETFHLPYNINIFLIHLNDFFLTIYIIEIIIKIIAYRMRFFKNTWNVFDLVIVLICSISSVASSLIVLRSIKILRILRLLSSFPNLRFVTSALVRSFHPMLSVGTLLLIFFYIYAVLCYNLFSDEFPQFFGSLGGSLFSLFQIMTFEAWSMGIARPVMAIYPHAWIIFVTFILIVSFIVLNLAVGIIVDSISDISRKEQSDCECDNEMEELRKELIEIKQMISDLKQKNREM